MISWNILLMVFCMGWCCADAMFLMTYDAALVFLDKKIPVSHTICHIISWIMIISAFVLHYFHII